MRELLVVDVSDPRALTEPLRAALFDDGPAVLPRPGGAKMTATAPLEVDDAIALVVETSGTTGAPKRVALSAQAVLAGARAATLELGGPGQWLQVLPAHYIAGIQVTARSLVSGTTPRALHPQPFSTVAMADCFSALRDQAAGLPLFTSMVPAQLRRILDDAPGLPGLHHMMQSFGAILVGGQAIPADVLRRSREAGYTVIRTYGSSETAGGCVWNQRPIGATTVAVFDGRLAISGPTLATEYLDNPEGTARAFIEREGTRWYLSDDAGRVDATGLIIVEGRLDDVIVSGGVKVVLGAVEKILNDEFPGLDVYVVGVSHDQWGHVPVVISTGVVDLVRARLAIQKVLGVEARPDRVIQVPTIPLLASGKPDRLALAALAQQGLSHA
jgi:O-succinylbenzoic acid--CoA ligase